jgi:CBS domain-containing protein
VGPAPARVPLLGAGPVFPVHPHLPLPAVDLAAAAVLGIAAGFGSGLLTALVYGCEDLFQKLPIHWMWWPAIGGLCVGVGGLVDPRVLGVGYGTIHSLLAGDVAPKAAATLAVTKSVVWSLALGSGTSGGVLAPLLMMGGALGSLASAVLPHGDAGLWATVGMAAMMGGTMRSPLTAIFFAVELTYDWNLLPGLLVACVAAYAVTVLLMRRSILTEKVARRGHHVFREYAVDPFHVHRVGEVMDRRVPTVPTSMSVHELARLVAGADPELARRQGTPVVDSAGRLVGIVTRSDLMRALDREPAGAMGVLEAGSRQLVVAYEDELIAEAVERMLSNDVGRLPVVSREDPTRLVGYLGRAGVVAARQRLIDDESIRERGSVAVTS